MGRVTKHKATPLAMPTETISDGERLTLDERVTALEKAFAKLALREHNNEFTRLGSPPQGVFAPTPIASTSDQHAEMRQLERELAYSAARSDIECTCQLHTPFGPGCSWDTSTVTLEAAFANAAGRPAQLIARAVQYLEWLGCIERDPAAPQIVMIKELP